MPIDVANNIPQIVGAIGALGTAAFGLVDATKAFGGGVSKFGLGFIDDAIKPFLGNGIEAGSVRRTLRGHWINGTALGDQKAIAKSLIKVNLSAGTAHDFAKATGVDPGILHAVASKIESHKELTQKESDTFGRFDLALTARVDDAYSHADQRYRNAAKVVAACLAVILAVVGLFIINPHGIDGRDVALAILCGVIATPLAPIAKDVASALQAGVKLAQVVKR